LGLGLPLLVDRDRSDGRRITRRSRRSPIARNATPELGRIWYNPKKKDLSEMVREEFAKYDAEILAIAG
jgi:hypothetical protein